MLARPRPATPGEYSSVGQSRLLLRSDHLWVAHLSTVDAGQKDVSGLFLGQLHCLLILHENSSVCFTNAFVGLELFLESLLNVKDLVNLLKMMK